MYTDLIYQQSSFDCGPSSVLNGLRQLFERHEIPPEMIRTVYNTCMNEHDKNGQACRGTDMHAMRFLCIQLNEYCPKVNFPLEARFLCTKDVTLSDDSEIVRWVKDGGVSVMRIFVGVGHYVLITKITETDVYIWDPYLEEMPMLDGVSYHTENRRDYNLIVSKEHFEQYGREMFMMSEESMRNTLLLRRSD